MLPRRGGCCIPLLPRDQLGPFRVALVGGRHDLHAVLVEADVTDIIPDPHPVTHLEGAPKGHEVPGDEVGDGLGGADREDHPDDERHALEGTDSEPGMYG